MTNETKRECYNDGCTGAARERSSYCSTECYEEDTGTTPSELLDPDAQ